MLLSILKKMGSVQDSKSTGHLCLHEKHAHVGQAIIETPAQSAQWTKIADIWNTSSKLVFFYLP